MSESASMKVAAVAATHFDPIIDQDKAVFLVPKNGPRVALPLRSGEARESVLALYLAEHKAIPTQTALTDGLAAVAAATRDVKATTVGLRVAEAASGSVFVDLGRDDGAVIAFTADGWRVQEPDEGVLFRRTALTAEMALPTFDPDGHGLEYLRDLLNVDDEGWAMVLGWLVAAFIPDLAHPVLLVRGEQGTGKSVLARMLIDLVDPSVVPLRRAPRDEAAWIVPAAGSWVVGVDNVSAISEWWSDALCSVVTGDGEAKRKLYTDGDLVVASFRRAVVLTSIGVPTVRGDLGDRLITVEAQAIRPEARKTERELRLEFEARRPFILGELCDLVQKVLGLRASSAKRMKVKSRMADFAVVLDALDRAEPETRALEFYLGQQGRLNQDVIEGDLVALAMLGLAEAGGWEGTMAELLARLPLLGVGEREVPRTPKALSVRLKRLQPALRAADVHLTKRGSNGRYLIGVCLGTDNSDNSDSE